MYSLSLRIGILIWFTSWEHNTYNMYLLGENKITVLLNLCGTIIFVVMNKKNNLEEIQLN